jgi:hypothetical protein
VKIDDMEDRVASIFRVEKFVTVKRLSYLPERIIVRHNLKQNTRGMFSYSDSLLLQLAFLYGRKFLSLGNFSTPKMEAKLS